MDARARKAEILLANRTMQELASIEREEALCCEIRDLVQRLPFGGLDAAASVRLKKLDREGPASYGCVIAHPNGRRERVYDYGPRIPAYL